MCKALAKRREKSKCLIIKGLFAAVEGGRFKKPLGGGFSLEKRRFGATGMAIFCHCGFSVIKARSAGTISQIKNSNSKNYRLTDFQPMCAAIRM